MRKLHETRLGLWDLSAILNGKRPRASLMRIMGMTMRLMHTSLEVGIMKRLACSEWANHTGEGQTNPTSYGELADGLFGPRGV
ncbi:hypothetical protein CDL15_Pgr004510 [Punica granatum]|uniref:Uncharacterized protein n=1 Tax=Punica granatum TaxID=22663 RepID=A0A218WZ57_PUNGR|nr:hypothetical protein CDL15_Pgr004510 [Punica granatum]